MYHFITNYRPTPWEKLSEEEKLLLATYHAHVHQEQDLDQQIQFRSFLRDIREKNQQLSRKRYLEKRVIRQERASPTPSVDTDNGDSDHTTPSQIAQNSEAPSQLQRDLVAAKELRARVENLQMTTLKRKETATASREEPPQNMEKSSAMKIDEIDSECSEATPKRPITPEIRILSKEDQIRLRESQKVLQKLIDNEEIESYVKGWNPWDEKKLHFPSPPKKNLMKFKRNEPGKKQSSSSTNFSDPAKWRKVTDLLQMASGLYQNV
ncbi:hypothetical protein PGT21_018321 [Puccinia graminis f. sp. tritici]|uniref:Uncharacterized protein n=1 Tax=Puccinia graminis f. sp. tritici TaxID=56615 RepID=A0A5B0QN21_PUCGR|nr:hypothetical protein PGT21_018321 [Puccinia graminis f. sp. tritici]